MRPPPVPGHITGDMPAAKPFTFICGADDFLVGRLGQARFDALAAEIPDEFSREVLSGFAGNVGEVEGAVNRFRESVQTVSMFGGRRVIWLKDVNFLADTVTGRAESTLKLVEDLQRRLGTKVRLVERGNGKGTLEVEFFSYEDLDRIIHLIKR